MRNSKYWDAFEERITETISCLKDGKKVPVRRVAVFVTDRCNFRCEYCNGDFKGAPMTLETFEAIVHRYGSEAIIHITGGEPSTVPWLYPFLQEHGDKFKFHLNSNAYITPPAESVKRLKISLDSTDAESWDKIVGRKGAWEKVVSNIKDACDKTVVSITYTLSKKNYRNAVEFAKFCNKEFPGLYAVFFSVYKGSEPDYKLDPASVSDFHENVLPELLETVNDESRELLKETIDEKRRLMEGVRFEQNCTKGICYLSMSERVVGPDGRESTCSHLYRDGIYPTVPIKYKECKYGCNRRLVAFNEEVENRLFGINKQ